jgi:Flp pilus assembly protein TadD
MTVLSPAPVTAMGLPLRAGLSCCSTEAKKASMSTQTIIPTMLDYTRMRIREQPEKALAQMKPLRVVAAEKSECGGGGRS